MVAKAPSPGDHKGRPYYATAWQAGACMVAKERFFLRPDISRSVSFASRVFQQEVFWGRSSQS